MSGAIIQSMLNWLALLTYIAQPNRPIGTYETDCTRH